MPNKPAPRWSTHDLCCLAMQYAKQKTGVKRELALAYLEALEALRGEIRGDHVYNGLCPEPGNEDSRDCECEQCQRLIVAMRVE